MSGEELDDWIDFFAMEPFGNEEIMADKRNSLLCHVSAMGGEHTPKDFQMYADKEEQEDNEILDWEAKLIRAMTTI